jgi:hypothetical protein
MSTFIKKKPTKKRKHGRAPIVAGDINSSRVVTTTRTAVTQSDGTVVIQKKLEPLYAKSQSVKDKQIESEFQPIAEDHIPEPMDYMSPPPGRTKTYRVRTII